MDELSDEVELRLVEADSDDARWCLDRYFAELAARFDDGFDPCSSTVPIDPATMAPPRGGFVVAYRDELPVGCGGIRTIGPGLGEIKRMWLDPSVRGRGLGRRLLAELEARSRSCRHERVRLDTNGSLVEAIAMYRSSGYVDIDPYSDEVHAEHWFEKRLR